MRSPHNCNTLGKYEVYKKNMILICYTIWAIFGLLWPNLGYCELLLVMLAYFGLLWSILSYFGLLWANLVNFGQFGLLWAIIGYVGLLWANFGQFWSIHIVTHDNLSFLYTYSSIIYNGSNLTGRSLLCTAESGSNGSEHGYSSIGQKLYNIS